MKKRTQLILLAVSLAVSSFSAYRMANYVGRFSVERYVHAILIGLSAALILYMFYKNVIKRFSKGHVDHKKYAKLFELEHAVVTGELEFYFTIEDPKDIRFSILSKDMQLLEVVKEGPVSRGGHIVRYETTKLEDGIYFYCLETDNQKTMKRMRVQHVKVTA